MKTYIIALFIMFLNPAIAQAKWQIGLDILGHPLKKSTEELTLQLSVKSTDNQQADIYLAVQLPDKRLFFLTAPTIFSTSIQFSNSPVAYTTKLNGKLAQTGIAFALSHLAANLPGGQYHFYTVATQVGADVYKQSLWQTPLVQKDFFFVNNTNILSAPPQLTGVLNNQGQKVFDLTLQQGQKSFLPNTKTATLGINGDYLGPTIRVSQGDKVLFNISNKIGEQTTIHWHGAHIPAKMDGGPHQIIENNSTWHPFFDIKQPAATLWYHPHLEGKTSEHVYKGLAGFFIIDDKTSTGLALPHRYGVDDIPVVVQDRRIAPDGNMSNQLRNMQDITGLRGQYILVNGSLTPTLESLAQVIRLRLLNGSNARIYNFGFADNHTFYQIASDGGLLENPVSLNRLRLAPGERAEILVDLRAKSGQYLRLQSFSADITPTTMESNQMRAPLDMQTFDILTIRVGQSGNNGLSIPTQLTNIQALRRQDAVKTRSFVLNMGMGGSGGMGNSNGMQSGNNGLLGNNNTETFNNLHNRGMFTINNKVMDRNRIDETIRLGNTEIWEVSNKSKMAHPFHVHDIQFLILDRNNQLPSLGEAGWKDTVLVLPNETVRIITRFDDFADANTPYMYHCHILEHEDAGMMGQFVVIP